MPHSARRQGRQHLVHEQESRATAVGPRSADHGAEEGEALVDDDLAQSETGAAGPQGEPELALVGVRPPEVPRPAVTVVPPAEEVLHALADGDVVLTTD